MTKGAKKGLMKYSTKTVLEGTHFNKIMAENLKNVKK